MIEQESMEEEREEQPYNANDAKQVNSARKRAARKKILQDEIIRGIMSVKEGREWINHILTMGDMFGNPHVRGDAYDSAFNMGMANLAKLIWMEIEEVVPESCAMMRKEARDNEKQADK